MVIAYIWLYALLVGFGLICGLFWFVFWELLFVFAVYCCVYLLVVVFAYWLLVAWFCLIGYLWCCFLLFMIVVFVFVVVIGDLVFGVSVLLVVIGWLDGNSVVNYLWCYGLCCFDWLFYWFVEFLLGVVLVDCWFVFV